MSLKPPGLHTGQGPREKAGSWVGEGGRETEIHTDRDLPEKPEERVWPYFCSLKPHELPDKGIVKYVAGAVPLILTAQSSSSTLANRLRR